MASDRWPFVPRSIRVHPLTRVHARDGQTVLEGWVQLLDRDGYPARGLGSVSVSLDSAGPGTLQQYSWTAQLETPGAEGARYDPVTQSYMLTLALDPALLPSRPRVQAVLTTPGGQRYSDRLVIDAAHKGE